MTQKTFSIRIPSDFDLTVDEIWPDGDAPENPTPEDVKKVIEKCGGILTVIRDWDLLSNKDYEVKDVTLSTEVLERLRRATEARG